ncbi:MAG: DUF4433 domain-containing protein [Chloroflexota bacterium]
MYHITHIDNLPSICGDGRLHCCSELRGRNAGDCDIAHAHIQDRRAATSVPCAAGGRLHDYVPFYFAPRSPMLYAIGRGNVAGYSDGAGPIIHLVSSVAAVAAAGIPFAFTDGHATVAITRFFSSLEDLDQVDWPVMSQTYWNDTNEDPDRKRRRQAEFLVHRAFPWHLIEEIGVASATVRQRVEDTLKDESNTPRITIQRGWYYH